MIPVAARVLAALLVFHSGDNTLLDTFLITVPLLLSPGPANLISMAFASRYGSRKIASFQCGIVLVYAIVACGIAATANQLGDFFTNSAVYVQIAGGVFIIYLGVRLILKAHQPVESDNAPTFQSGVVLQLFNPKFPPVVLTVLSTTSDTNFLTNACVIVAVGVIGLAVYSCAGSLIRRSTWVERRLGLLNIVFGVLLCAVGGWIALGTVTN